MRAVMTSSNTSSWPGFFFFQAEDGIRYHCVTGVQTCALPIFEIAAFAHPMGEEMQAESGAHLIYMCDAGFGLHFLAHWVRERGDFDLVEGIRRLTRDRKSVV